MGFTPGLDTLYAKLFVTKMGLLGPCAVGLLAESSAYPLIYILISVLLTAFSSLCRKTRVINVCWKVRTSGSYIKVSFVPGVHGRNDFLFSSCLHGLLSCDLFPYYAWFPKHLNLLLTFSFHFVRSAGFALRALVMFFWFSGFWLFVILMYCALGTN